MPVEHSRRVAFCTTSMVVHGDENARKPKEPRGDGKQVATGRERGKSKVNGASKEHGNEVAYCVATSVLRVS